MLYLFAYLIDLSFLYFDSHVGKSFDRGLGLGLDSLVLWRNFKWLTREHRE